MAVKKMNLNKAHVAKLNQDPSNWRVKKRKERERIKQQKIKEENERLAEVERLKALELLAKKDKELREKLPANIEGSEEFNEANKLTEKEKREC